MKWSSVKKFFVENWDIKLLSILIAVLLRFSIINIPISPYQKRVDFNTTNDTNPQADMILEVKLEVLHPPKWDLDDIIPDKVQVTIRGEERELRGLKEGDIRAVIDLKGINKEFSRDIVAYAPPKVKVVKIVPVRIISRIKSE